jgi:hypothetical protein
VVDVERISVEDDDLVNVANAFGLVLPGLEMTHHAAGLFPSMVRWYEHVLVAFAKRGQLIGVEASSRGDAVHVMFQMADGDAVLVDERDRQMTVISIVVDGKADIRTLGTVYSSSANESPERIAEVVVQLIDSLRASDLAELTRLGIAPEV